MILESFRFEDENKYEYKIKLKVFAHNLKKKTPQKASIYSNFYQKKLVWLFILKEVKPSPDSKMIKLLTFEDSYRVFQPK